MAGIIVKREQWVTNSILHGFLSLSQYEKRPWHSKDHMQRLSFGNGNPYTPKVWVQKNLLSMHIIWAQFKMIIYNLTKKFDRMSFFRLLAPKILG